MNEAVSTALDRPRNASHEVQNRRPAHLWARSLSAPSGSVLHTDALQDLLVDRAPAPSHWVQYPEAGCAIHDTLGPGEAFELAQLDRDEAILALRVRHRWSLQAIGDLFDLSRERIRQLTHAIDGNCRTPGSVRYGTQRDPAETRGDLLKVFRLADRDHSAWNGHGKVSKPSVVNKLGYDPRPPAIGFRSPAQSKVEFIVRHGMGLDTRSIMRAWFQAMYFDRRMTYG